MVRQKIPRGWGKSKRICTEYSSYWKVSQEESLKKIQKGAKSKKRGERQRNG